jgi:hypothetical protein
MLIISGTNLKKLPFISKSVSLDAIFKKITRLLCSLKSFRLLFFL